MEAVQLVYHTASNLTSNQIHCTILSKVARFRQLIRKPIFERARIYPTQISIWFCETSIEGASLPLWSTPLEGCRLKAWQLSWWPVFSKRLLWWKESETEDDEIGDLYHSRCDKWESQGCIMGADRSTKMYVQCIYYVQLYTHICVL